jgi:hypothetical protein
MRTDDNVFDSMLDDAIAQAVRRRKEQVFTLVRLDRAAACLESIRATERKRPVDWLLRLQQPARRAEWEQRRRLAAAALWSLYEDAVALGMAAQAEDVCRRRRVPVRHEREGG